MTYEDAYQWLHGDRIEYSGCRRAAEAMEAEVKRLRALIATQAPARVGLTDDARDAARYRWLRDGCDAKDSPATRIATRFYGIEWDAAIDVFLAAGITEASTGTDCAA